jgi:hypothetical protein
VTGQHPPSFGSDWIDLVSFGMGRFLDEHMQDIAVNEPLMLCAALRWWFSDDSFNILSDFKTSITQHLATAGEQPTNESPLPSARTFNAAYSLVWYFANAFIKNRKAHYVFDFAKPEPEWAKSGSRLVLLRRSAQGRIHQRVLNESDLLPDSPPLACRAESQQDVLAFLRIEKDAAFCICSGHCHADLIFAMKLANQKLIWVFLHCRPNHGTTFDEQDFGALLNQLSPENLFGVRILKCSLASTHRFV